MTVKDLENILVGAPDSMEIYIVYCGNGINDAPKTTGAYRVAADTEGNRNGIYIEIDQ